MSLSNLIRWGGLAAIVAGILRAVNSFLPPTLPTVAIELLYLVTDIFLLFGTLGLYICQHRESKLWGFWGCSLALVGICTIRTRMMAGVNLYPIGAIIFAMGICALAVGAWGAGKLPRWISVVWIVSTLMGFIGYFSPSLNLLFAISGVLFGIGFAAAGLTVWFASIDRSTS